MDGQLRVQVSSLMKTAFYLCGGKSCFLKNLRVRKEIDAGSGLSGSGKLGEKSLLQLDGRNASLIVVVMHIAVTADLNVKIGRQGVYNRRSNAVKTAACLVCRIVEFASSVKRGKYKTLCGYAFCMHINRDSSSVILYGTGAVLLQGYFYIGAVTSQMLIYRIVHNLINQMVQTLPGYTSDVHSRTFPDSLQSFQDGNTPRVVSVFLCHGVISFLCFDSIDFKLGTKDLWPLISSSFQWL